MSGHTPWPWMPYVDSEHGLCVQDGIPASKANMRLIAAAPDLLHACRLIIENAPHAADWLERNHIGAYTQVQAAIAKATQP